MVRVARAKTSATDRTQAVIDAIYDRRMRFDLVTPDGKKHRAWSMRRAIELGRELHANLQPGECVKWFAQWADPIEKNAG